MGTRQDDVVALAAKVRIGLDAEAQEEVAAAGGLASDAHNLAVFGARLHLEVDGPGRRRAE